MIIGITGGVGSGKTTLLEYIQSCTECEIYYLDDEAKKFQEKGMPVYESIVEEFGVDILCEDGEIDRTALAEIVFSDEKKLLLLNSITKDVVVNEIKKIIKNCNRKKLIFLESAILLDCDLRYMCDEIWYIYVDKEIRRDRLKTYRGYSDERITNMFQRQKQDEYFRSQSNVIINNNDSDIMHKEVLEALRKCLMEI